MYCLDSVTQLFLFSLVKMGIYSPIKKQRIMMGAQSVLISSEDKEKKGEKRNTFDKFFFFVGVPSLLCWSCCRLSLCCLENDVSFQNY